jgi:hypothetical protein
MDRSTNIHPDFTSTTARVSEFLPPPEGDPPEQGSAKKEKGRRRKPPSSSSSLLGNKLQLWLRIYEGEELDWGEIAGLDFGGER